MSSGLQHPRRDAIGTRCSFSEKKGDEVDSVVIREEEFINFRHKGRGVKGGIRDKGGAELLKQGKKKVHVLRE